MELVEKAKIQYAVFCACLSCGEGMILGDVHMLRLERARLICGALKTAAASFHLGG